MNFPRRGEIYWVNLDPAIGTEIAKTRPALIISNDIGNEYSQWVIVSPITSQNIRKIYPFEALLPKGEGGLSRDSKALLDQIRSVDKRRLGEKLGTIPSERMAAVDRAILISLAVE